MKTDAVTLPNIEKGFFQFPGIDSIPSEPRIPLKNYLLNLVTESDGKESSIYLKGIEKFIKEIWDEMIKDNWKTLRVRQFIPEKLGVRHMMLYAYKNGKKAISIQNSYKLLFLWKKYCQKNNRDVEKKWNKIYESDFTFSVHKASAPTKLPKYLFPKLSYLIGFICGDGHLTDYGNHYILRLSEKSIPQLMYLQSLFKSLFNIKIPLFKIYESGHALQVGNKAIYRFFIQVLKIKVGEIPKSAKNLDQINKKYFLMGIFDSEGSVDSSYLDARIVIHQADSKFLKEVINLFKDLNIRFTGPYRHQTQKGIWYHIQIRKKLDILKFIKEIGTCHVTKFQKLKILEKKLYAHRYRYNST